MTEAEKQAFFKDENNYKDKSILENDDAYSRDDSLLYESDIFYSNPDKIKWNEVRYVKVDWTRFKDPEDFKKMADAGLFQQEKAYEDEKFQNLLKENDEARKEYAKEISVKSIDVSKNANVKFSKDKIEIKDSKGNVIGKASKAYDGAKISIDKDYIKVRFEEKGIKPLEIPYKDKVVVSSKYPIKLINKGNLNPNSNFLNVYRGDVLVDAFEANFGIPSYETDVNVNEIDIIRNNKQGKEIKMMIMDKDITPNTALEAQRNSKTTDPVVVIGGNSKLSAVSDEKLTFQMKSIVQIEQEDPKAMEEVYPINFGFSIAGGASISIDASNPHENTLVALQRPDDKKSEWSFTSGTVAIDASNVVARNNIFVRKNTGAKTLSSNIKMTAYEPTTDNKGLIPYPIEISKDNENNLNKITSLKSRVYIGNGQYETEEEWWQVAKRERFVGVGTDIENDEKLVIPKKGIESIEESEEEPKNLQESVKEASDNTPLVWLLNLFK